MLAPESQEDEIKDINNDLRRVMRYAQQKANMDIPPR